MGRGADAATERHMPQTRARRRAGGGTRCHSASALHAHRTQVLADATGWLHNPPHAHPYSAPGCGPTHAAESDAAFATPNTHGPIRTRKHVHRNTRARVRRGCNLPSPCSVRAGKAGQQLHTVPDGHLPDRWCTCGRQPHMHGLPFKLVHNVDGRNLGGRLRARCAGAPLTPLSRATGREGRLDGWGRGMWCFGGPASTNQLSCDARCFALTRWCRSMSARHRRQWLPGLPSWEIFSWWLLQQRVLCESACSGARLSVYMHACVSTRAR